MSNHTQIPTIPEPIPNSTATRRSRKIHSATEKNPAKTPNGRQDQPHASPRTATLETTTPGISTGALSTDILQAVTDTVSAGDVPASIEYMGNEKNTLPAAAGEGTKTSAKQHRYLRALSAEEPPTLTKQMPVPDVSADAEPGNLPEAVKKRPRRSRRSRRLEQDQLGDNTPAELAAEQTVHLPAEVLEELIADVLVKKTAAGSNRPTDTSEEKATHQENKNTVDGDKKAVLRSHPHQICNPPNSPEAEETPEKNESEGVDKKTVTMPRKMLISILPGDQVEVVLTEHGQVCEYYVEMTHQIKLRGNIYKGIISNIDTNLQAAFVNYGNSRNGFLQIDEIHPEYYLQPHDPSKGYKYPPIQKVLKIGQEVLVQVVKEPNGNKGAFLTTWISLAGRFLVLTPGQEQIGISRKVEDSEERNRLRELIRKLEPGKGLGAIIRTASEGTNKTTLQKDLNFLKRLWKDIRKRATTEKAPSLIYQEPGLARRSVRDYLSDDVVEVWVDDESTSASIREMAALLYPRKSDLVHLYTGQGKTLWEYFNILPQLQQIHAREVTLPSGGRLVFDQTEALMAIDINSGKIGGKKNFEAMAYKTNMEAALAIARQLRLRDIGGQIVIDFIEMRDPEHCREVEKEIRTAMKTDRARHDIGKMSSFGLLQIVRQRIGSSAISISMEPCPYCNGTGQRRTMEWQAIQAQRELHRGLRSAATSGTSFLYTVDPELGLYLLNNKREQISALEQEFHTRIEIKIDGIAPTSLPPAEKNGKQA